MKKHIPQKLLFFCFSLIFITFTACKAHNFVPIAKVGFNFDTVITITLYDSSDEALLDSCFELADYYENIFSKSIQGSDIYKINNANGASVEVSPETIELLSIALKYSQLTNGIVDPTIGIVSELWDFHKQDDTHTSDNPNSPHTPPSDTAISEAINHINYNSIQITGNSVTLLDHDAQIDLGFIAKGYIADKIKEHLVTKGVSNAIINLGGNVLTIGSKPDGPSYTIGIQEPFAQTGTAITTVSIKDKSVVTSGIYERYFYFGNELYHHILDTQTGYPVTTDLLGVSIISDSSTEGDALSTACLALGYEKSLELINSLDNIDALFITTDGTIHTTY